MSTTEPGIDPISPVSPEAITSRQREVARLVAAGRTNVEIAEELGITRDGAKYHVSELLTRLGLRRREEIAEWYRAHFGPVARFRSWLRGIVGMPIVGIAGQVAVVGGVLTIAAFAFIGLRDDPVPPLGSLEQGVPGRFEHLLSQVPQGYEHGLMLGDIEAWRDLAGVEAPVLHAVDASGYSELSAFDEVYGVHPFFDVPNNYWYFGVGGDALRPTGAPTVSERAAAVFAVTPQEVTGYAWDLLAGPTTAWGLLSGTFEPESAAIGVANCEVCLEAQTSEANDVTIWDWSYLNETELNDNSPRRYALPLFDDIGWGNAVFVQQERVLGADTLNIATDFAEGSAIVEDPTRRQAARLVDRAGLLYVQFFDRVLGVEPVAERSLGLGDPFRDGSLPLLDPYPFIAVGGGYDEENKEPFTLIALPFEDESQATSNVSRVERRFDALDHHHLIGEPNVGLEGWGERTWSDFLEDVEVRPDGRFLVIRSEGVSTGGCSAMPCRRSSGLAGLSRT